MADLPHRCLLLTYMGPLMLHTLLASISKFRDVSNGFGFQMHKPASFFHVASSTLVSQGGLVGSIIMLSLSLVYPIYCISAGHDFSLFAALLQVSPDCYYALCR